MKPSSLPLNLVCRVFSYNPETGLLLWAEPQSRRVAVGSPAGAKSANGRLYVGLLGEHILAHRLVWFIHYGEWPKANLAPKDGDYLNLRIANWVEEDTFRSSQKEAHARSTSRSGVKGVSWNVQKQKWVAILTRHYRRFHLGYFDQIEDAAAAVRQAETETPDKPASSVPTAEQISLRKRLRTEWASLKKHGGPIDRWPTFELFAVDIGLPPTRFHRLVSPTPDILVWSDAHVTERQRRQRADRRNRPDVYRGYDLKRDFGISLADYAAMLKEQNGVCAICHEPETSIRDGKLKQLAVDHDHETGAIRGLLCSNCNPMIGYAKDSPERLEAGAAYLRERKVRTNVVPIKKDTA